jgi:hypothetical protein
MKSVQNLNFIINELMPYTLIVLRVEFIFFYWNTILLTLTNKKYFSAPFTYLYILKIVQTCLIKI